MFLTNKIIYFILFAVLLTSCAKEEQIPDVSEITVEFDTIRYDRIMMAWDTSRLNAEMESSREAYPVFTDLYWGRIIPLETEESEDPDLFYREVGRVIKAPSMQALHDSCQLEFPDLQQIYKDFQDAFRYYEYYFPERQCPDVYTFISEFGYATILFRQENGKDAIGVGLDMFLGERFDYTLLSVFNSAFSQYITRTFNKQHLVKKGLDALIDDMIAPPRAGRMIDFLLYEGKKWYVLDKLMPHTPDSIKWEYTSEQTKWVRENEWNIWVYLVDDELLYSTRMSEFTKLISPSPTSPGMPPEAPGQASVYIGYQMVKAYMEKFPDTALEQLLAMTDGQEFLTRSKYKPKR